MTTRRQILLATAIGAFAPGAFAQARQITIGMLSPRPLRESFYSPAVVGRLAELGYRDGSGTNLYYRSADGHAERYPKLAHELVGLKCDVIFAIGPEPAVRALQQVGSQTPIVFLALEYDPVEKGVVSSLRRPDRHTTGIYSRVNEIAAKRLEIMREVLPAARRFMVLADPTSRDQLPLLRKASDTAGAELFITEFAKAPYDYAWAFEQARRQRVEGFIGLASAVFAADEPKIAGLLVQHRLPSIGPYMTDFGYLLFFAASRAKLSRRLAEIGVRVLKGTNPADIPVEQADEFDLVINAKTAAALGVKIPERVLARATKIIS